MLPSDLNVRPPRPTMLVSGDIQVRTSLPSPLIVVTVLFVVLIVGALEEGIWSKNFFWKFAEPAPIVS